MAQPTNTFDTYDSVGEREDLSDVIYSISPTDTPFISSAAKTKATAVLHEWQTDALAAAATLSANVALADVSISGFMEWKYQSRSSNITALDGTSNTTDSDIKFKFDNKTDSGLTVGYYAEMNADGSDDSTSIEESYLHISGGFGKIVQII